MQRTGPAATSEHNEWDPLDALLWSKISQAFTALTLLTRSKEWAEKALLQAIGTLDPIGITSTGLALGAIELTPNLPKDNVIASREHEEVSVNLPPELQAVFVMPSTYRRCFVLRILLGVPAHRCAAILNQTVDQVNESTSAALLYLAGPEQYALCANGAKPTEQ